MLHYIISYHIISYYIISYCREKTVSSQLSAVSLTSVLLERGTDRTDEGQHPSLPKTTHVGTRVEILASQTPEGLFGSMPRQSNRCGT